MNIGLVIHSKTGNTLSVAEKLKSVLLSLGHEVTLMKLHPLNPDVSKAAEVQLETLPVVKPFDALILGAPVWGFQLSPVMQYYLKNTVFKPGAQVSVFVTQYFPFAFLGGNNAIRTYQKLLGEKNIRTVSNFVVGWSNERKRIQSMDEMVKVLSGQFTPKYR